MNRPEAFDTVGQLPHCDSSVLHCPGECEYCDRHPDWQALRMVWGIAFTGHAPVPLYDGGPLEAPCPSDYRRGTGQAHTWGGNRPTTHVVLTSQYPYETFASQVMYNIDELRALEDWPPPSEPLPDE